MVALWRVAGGMTKIASGSLTFAANGNNRLEARRVHAANRANVLHRGQRAYLGIIASHMAAAGVMGENHG